jgi:DNA polymerase IV
MGAQRALGCAQRTEEELDAILIALVERVARRLRAAGRVGRTVVLRFRFADYTRATRSHTLPQATAETQVILAALRALLVVAGPTIESRGLTLLGIAVSNLDDGATAQLALDSSEGAALDAALDAVRDRFGSSSVQRAVLVGRDAGQAMPMLPDE